MNQEQENLYNELVSKYDFNESQLSQIRMGIISHLNVSIYAKPEFNYKQMGEIRLGLGDNLDVSWYAKPEFG